MTQQLMTDIQSDAENYGGDAMIFWKGPKGRTLSAPASRALLAKNIFDAPQFRLPKSYRNQRNYFGRYYFSQVPKHLWHESLNEANMMMYLDHVESIDGISSQPFKVVFADGGWHIPDLLALHSNGRQVVYDIKPAQSIKSKEMAQFAKTQALCDQVGWAYRVLPGLPEQMLRNLQFLALFKHPRYAPPAENAALLLAELETPLRFDDAADVLAFESKERSRAALMHLLWLRIVQLDMNSPIRRSTAVERTPNAQA